MLLSELTDPSAVVSAMKEFDQLGRETFLQKYGYAQAKHYFVIHEGKSYDSKAIAGVAFETQLAALVGFRSVPMGISKFVKVGDIEVQEFSWIANSEQTPEDSGKFLADEIDTWLQSKLALLDVG